MGIIGWIVLGLLAGAIAKLILPGRQGGGWLATLLLGVVGALLGGFLGSAIFGVGLEDFWSIQTWLVAIVGAIIVLLIWGFITGRRGRTSRA
ncbi:GlsB/YeaQ/YmgE family stress response membrane protein [Herbiconiux sp. SYSU D00978]|uniref:GlsB/YeaQ/YmgE family stress response membrane protein n=1 Tax=Herbiconiux sp. SYSU D00978 TaxID=2812562 RepID=UPI001A97273C|nr:GlsB/YeaQ/YmgE family stress response membrane protein [Herbiconiux sp. SYSU D00978]